MAGESNDQAEAMRAALTQCGVSELQEMAKRLVKSHAELSEMLAELDSEQAALRDEQANTRETIELMLQEMHKLNIGSGNTVEPRLLEGPLNFVGRYWEKMRPRDNTYLKTPQIGELSKLSTAEDSSPTQQLSKVGQTMSTTLRQITGDMVSAVREELSNVQRPFQPEQTRKKKKKRSKVPSTFDGDLSPSANHEEFEIGTPRGKKGPASETELPEQTSSSSSSAVAAAIDTPAATAEEDLDKTPGGSPILIEAKITLEDGSEQGLIVRAAEGSKQVAKCFAQDHSLNIQTTKALTAWLKKAELDADSYPVKIAGTLSEICKTHGSSK